MAKTVMFIPACGFGSRVKELGHKPFLKIMGESALDRVMSMAPLNMDIEVALRADMGCPPVGRRATVHFLSENTAGQAETIWRWLWELFEDDSDWVLISNCDNLIDKTTIAETLDKISMTVSDGFVFTFTPFHKDDLRFSYVKVDGEQIIEIAEKKAISTHACAGVYLIKINSLLNALRPKHLYLSEALAAMNLLINVPVKHYIGWNDMGQIEELNAGIVQYRK